MSDLTAFLSLFKPGGGSTGLIVPDEVVDIDRINANMDLIDNYAAGWGQAANRNKQYWGPAASLAPTTGMKRGDTYQESDGNFVLWKYDGANWVTNEMGLTLIRPTSVVNGAINADGSVTPTTGQASCSLNNIFSSRYREYVVRYDVRLNTAATAAFRLRAAAVDLSSASYALEMITAAGASAPATSSTTGTDISLMGAASAHVAGSVEFCAPALAGSVKRGAYQSGSALLFHRTANWQGSGIDANVYDGLTLVAAGATFIATGAPFIKVYGLA
jgi:hypothetical protein